MNDFSEGVCIGFVRSDMLTVNKMFIHLVENAEINLKSVHRYSVDLWNESQSVVYLNGMHTNDLAVNNQQKVFFFQLSEVHHHRLLHTVCSVMFSLDNPSTSSFSQSLKSRRDCQTRTQLRSCALWAYLPLIHCSAVCRSFYGSRLSASIKSSLCVRPVSKQCGIVTPDILQIVVGCSQIERGLLL